MSKTILIFFLIFQLNYITNYITLPIKTLQKENYIKYTSQNSLQEIIFYEYWGELKKNTGYKDITFEDNSDFNLFSRAMIIPHKKFKDFFVGISNRSSELKISDIADKFSVLYSVIEDRIDDYGWIAN